MLFEDLWEFASLEVVRFGRFLSVVLEMRRMCVLMWCVLVCTEIDGCRGNASGLLTRVCF